MSLRIRSNSMYRDHIMTIVDYDARDSERAGGVVLKFKKWDGPPRACEECGKRVSAYKDGGQAKVWCYLHDHLTPWNHSYIMGSYENIDAYKRTLAEWTGKGRGCRKTTTE